MSWVWLLGAGWLVLAVIAAIPIGRSIRLADQGDEAAYGRRPGRRPGEPPSRVDERPPPGMCTVRPQSVLRRPAKLPSPRTPEFPERRTDW